MWEAFMDYMSKPKEKESVAVMEDRRTYFRLSAHLPLDIAVPDNNGKTVRRISSNVSAGGIYFQGTPDDGFQAGHKIGLKIAVPASSGRIPSEGILEGDAVVLRVDPVRSADETHPRVGIACIFQSPLRFA
jgi:hypothetical protein